MSEESNILYIKLRDSQEKYIYYLLGITVIAIGFIITNNQNIKLIPISIPIGIAIIFLSISFFSGLIHIEYINNAIAVNIKMLKIEAGEDPDFSHNSQYSKAAVVKIRKVFNFKIKKSNIYRWVQNILMITGMLSYFVFIILKAL